MCCPASAALPSRIVRIRHQTCRTSNESLRTRLRQGKPGEHDASRIGRSLGEHDGGRVQVSIRLGRETDESGSSDSSAVPRGRLDKSSVKGMFNGTVTTAVGTHVATLLFDWALN